MRNLKKVLVLVLCLAMMASIMVVGAGAVFTDAKDIDSQHQEAVDMSVALSIIQGYPDGSFQPNGNVTRAEMAKIICIALNGGKEPATSVKPTPTFADIDGHWAEGFIEYCYAKGIVAGKSADTFDPSGDVTGSEAAKMLLVALGYNADVEKYVGSDWALYVNVQANQDGLYDKLLDIQTAEPLSREHAAQMIWNALQAVIIEKHSQIDRTTGDISDVYQKNQNNVDMLGEFYKGDDDNGRMISFSYKDKDKEWTYSFDNPAIPNVKSTTDYTALLGQDVKVVWDADGTGVRPCYGIFANDSQVVVTGLIGDVSSLKNIGDSEFKLDGVTYKTDDSVFATEVYYFTDTFGTFAPVNNLYDMAKTGVSTYDAQKFTAVDYDGNGKVDFLMITPFDVGKVTYVSSSEFRVSTAYNGTVTYKFDDVTAYDGLAKDDYVCIVNKENTSDDTAVITKLDPISTSVSKFNAGDVTLDGTVYTIDDSYGHISGSAPVGNINAGAALTDVVSVNGYIFYVDKADKTNITDYAVVVATEAGGVSGARAKLLFTDGTKVVVDTDKDYTSIADLTLVTYSKNSDGEYILEKANTAVVGYNLVLQGTGVSVAKISNGSDKAGYINGAYIDDDSVIFITYEGGKSKVISGQQMKKMDYTEFGTFTEGYLLATKSDGSNHVDMAYVTVGSKPINDADTHYGYITASGIVKNADNNNVFEVTLWTADGETTLQTAETSTQGAKVGTDDGNMAKRQVIEYKLNTDGKISEVLHSWRVDAVDDAVYGTDGASTVAITSTSPTLKVQLREVVGDKSVYNILPSSPAAFTKSFMDLDSDTVYIFIENSDAVGKEATSIGTADDSSTPDYYVANAFIVVDKDGDVALVVYDVDNDIAE